MNGRVYDATLGRFLSADPNVQAPANTQSLNRYTYVNNNPLSYTDPSGYFFKKLFKKVKRHLYKWTGTEAVVGFLKKNAWARAIVSVVATIFQQYWVVAAMNAAVTYSNGGSLGDALKAGAISYGTAMAFSGLHGMEQGVMKVVAHGVVGGLSAAASGGNFKSGFLAAGFTTGLGSQIGRIGSQVGRAIAAAVVGGAAAKLGGGKFANGAVTGAFAYTLATTLSSKRSASEEVAMVSDAEMDRIVAASPRVSGIWTDAAAGFGDTISFGATRWVRDQLNINGAVDFDSGAYQGGEYAGYVFSAAGGAGGARAAGLGMKVYRYKNVEGWGAGITQGGKSRYLRVDYHNGVEKYYGTSNKVLHIHRGRTGNQMSKHR